MKRIEEIDIAKGIAIIMVVLGHSYTTCNGLTQLIGSFHMPFFFIVSGLLYRMQYDKNGSITFIYRKKARTLLLPWIIWGGTYQLFIGCLKIIGGQSIVEQIKTYVVELVELGFGSVWFLPALYMASAILLGTVGNKKISIMIVVACLIIGLYMPEYTGIANTLLRVAVACGFMGIGFFCAHIFMGETGFLENIISTLIFVFFVSYNGVVAMYSRTFVHPTSFLITGVLGTYILLNFCKYLKNYEGHPLIEYLKMYGKKSIIILCTHNFLIEAIRLFDYKLFNDWLMTLGILEGITLTAVVVFTLTLGMPFVEKYFGRTLGINVEGK